MDEKLVKEMVDDIKLREERSNMPVPVGISNRHIHLTKEDFKTLVSSVTHSLAIPRSSISSSSRMPTAESHSSAATAPIRRASCAWPSPA